MCRRLIFLICVVLVLGVAPSALAALPPGWTAQEIANPVMAPPGTANEDGGGVFTLTASGDDISGANDEFEYAFMPLRGDGEISAQVVSITGGTNEWRKAAVMIRETLADTSKNVAMLLSHPDYSHGNHWAHVLSFQFRQATGGTTLNSAAVPSGYAGLPYWIKLVRQGNLFTAYQSPNGVTWTRYSGMVVDMGKDVYIGLAVTAHDRAQVTTATFDNVSVLRPQQGMAFSPSPADASTVEAGYVSLMWSPGASATLHDVYYGTSFDAVNDANSSDPMGSDKVYKAQQSGTQYPPGLSMPVTRGQTYYWRIDEVNDVDTWRGDIWSFKVAANLNWNPSPQDQGKFVPVTTDLSWSKGALALLGHIVYFSTDFDDVNDAVPGTESGPAWLGTPTTTTIAIPGNLLYDTTYYWRADPVENTPPDTPGNTHKGEVWSFTTQSARVGSILREWWLGVNGGGIVNLLNYGRYPDHPSGAALMSLFEGPTTWGDNYGSRYQAWLLVPTTGDYTFWSASDDNSQLFLSTDEDPANAVMISQTTASAGARIWYDPDVTPSAPIHLEGGEMYYISALHKEGSGGDSMAVGWVGPRITSITVIPGSNLVPYMPAAINPSPANGAKDLPLTGTMLSWTAGFDAATFGDYASQRVYFGTDAAAVASAGVGSPEDKGAPTGTNSYGPVSLAYYKQYFWRIDGVTGGGQAVKGTVWSFTAIYDAAQIVDPNLVGWWKLDGNADDSSGYGNDGVENGSPLYVDAVDGLGIDFDGVNDYINCGNPPRFNMNTNITVACWVKGPFGPSWSPFVSKQGENCGWKLRRRGGTNNACFTLRGPSGGADPQGAININDNEWHHVAGTYDGAQRNLYVDGQLDTAGSPAGTGVITGSPADDVVIGAFSSAGSSPPIQSYSTASIDDARIYNRALTLEQIVRVMRINLAWAWNPSPKNNATGVSLDTVLSWTPGDYAPVANGHYVNFGADDPANMVRSGPQTPNNYTPSALDLDTVYYWAVDEVNTTLGGVDAGPIWRFTTTNNKVVDDFETYEDAGELDVNWIYFVYTDGFGDLKCTEGTGNGSGAKINLQRPGQPSSSIAMLLQYDNDGMVKTPAPCDPCETEVVRAYYSKAEALVAKLPSGIGSDWTAGGAKILSLSFYGDPFNVIEPMMWVQLTDSSNRKAKVFYGQYADEDINDMNEASWHEWLIDLEDFTPVEINDVNSIAIGVGDYEPTASPGGTGTLYFDDIRLYAPRCILVRRETDFAALDYAPAGTPGGDCKVDYKELDLMSGDWLEFDYNVAPIPPDPCGLAIWLKFEGDLTDSSVNGRDGTAVGAPTYPAGKDGQAVDLNGAGDAIHFNHGTIATDAYSMTFWHYPRNLPFTTDYRALMHTDVWSAGAIHLHLRANTSIVNFDWNGGVNVTASAVPLVSNEWYHVAMSADRTGASAEAKIYINGNLEASNTGTASALILGPFCIGAYQQNSRWVDGMFDDFRVYTYALSHNEVLSAGGLGTVYVPVTSPANISDDEPVLEKVVNFKDYAALMDRFLDEDFFP